MTAGERNVGEFKCRAQDARRYLAQGSGVSKRQPARGISSRLTRQPDNWLLVRTCPVIPLIRSYGLRIDRLSRVAISRSVFAKKTGPGQNPAPGPAISKYEMPSDTLTYCRFWDTTPIAVPITSPETTNSTRRFCCRPSAVSLDATGCVLPKPCAVMEAMGMFCWAR